MSIVPLNLGAAAPLMLNPHLTQVVAVSGFFVPQFGQNKDASQGAGTPPRRQPDDSHPSYTQGASLPSSLTCDKHPFLPTNHASLGAGRCSRTTRSAERVSLPADRERTDAHARFAAPLDTAPAGQLGFAPVAMGSALDSRP